MSHYIRKGRVYVTEGSSTFKITYQINRKTLQCQCASVGSINEICMHTQYYLTTALGVHPCYMPLLKISRVRAWLLEQLEQSPRVTGHTINDYCAKFLREDECSICMEHYCGSMRNITQCQGCHEPYHTACISRWKNGCPRCTYTHDLSSNAKDVIWPV